VRAAAPTRAGAPIESVTTPGHLKRAAEGAPDAGRRQSIVLRGDSATALTWAEEQRFRGKRVSSAAIVFTQLAAAGHLDAAGAHIGAADNWRTDILSRRNTWGKLGCSSVRDIMNKWGGQYAAAPVIELDNDTRIQELLALCRPAQQFDSEDQFGELWSSAARVARALAEPGSDATTDKRQDQHSS
jgi:hypothetical protein